MCQTLNFASFQLRCWRLQVPAPSKAREENLDTCSKPNSRGETGLDSVNLAFGGTLLSVLTVAAAPDC